MDRRTVTMNWDRLDDFNEEDDEFYESTNRMSVVVPLDMPLSEFDEDDDDLEFNDSRVSFSIDLATNSIKKTPNAVVGIPASTGQYDMWMVAPGSITDRRRRLLQDMGLNSKKDFARLASTTNTKFNKANTKRLTSIKPVVTSPDTNIVTEIPKPGPMVKVSSPHLEESKQVEQTEPKLQPQAQAKMQPQTQAQMQPQAKAETHPQPQPQSKPEPERPTQPEPKPKPEPEPEPERELEPEPRLQVKDETQNQIPVQEQAQVSSLTVMLVRSRSDSDIETNSFNTKRRKEDMIGKISKQRLTRTSSELVTRSIRLSCPYAKILKISTPNINQPKKSSVSTTKNKNNATSNSQLDSFFLIKNLDTGKEFVVKESNDEGMWNKVSDLETGKQLTMDEFDNTVGHSPVVKELMRRTSRKKSGSKLIASNSLLSKSFRSSKKKGAAILKTLKSSISMSTPKPEKEKEDSVATSTTSTTTNTTSSQSSSQTKGEQENNKEQKTSGEQKTNADKKSNSEWVKAKAYGKPLKEFSALHLCQEIQAHDGSIWTMKFSYDGQYLASGGEDKVIHVWEVIECDVMSMRGDDKGSITPDNRPPTPDNRPPLPDNSATTTDKKKKSKNNKKKGVPEYVKVPESMFGLSEKPVCTFKGHQDDVLDLSWSRSQLLLSSSMDKTVRLWDIETENCLKQFAHSDYVTCIQFNPTDDDYFISGSLDKKVRMWNIPSRKVVDWSDIHDMITAVCYYPDGQGAIVGLHNGNCKSYSTTDSKLEQKDQIELHTKPKAEPKKITSFQFSPSNPSEVLVTSADSRVKILDGLHVVEKLIGYKNTSSQFSAQYSADGKYVICASEDSQVYIWKHEKPKNSGGAKPKYVTTTSHEHFPCTDVTVAVPWSGSSKFQRLDNESQSKRDSKRSGPLSFSQDDNAQAKKSSQLPPVPKKSTEKGTNVDTEQPSNADPNVSESGDSSLQSDGSNNAANNNNSQSTAWGMVIVTAGVGGEIRVFQNVGLPVKVGYQTNLF